MATLAISRDGEAPVDQDLALRPVKDRLRQAREWRKRNFEPGWQTCLAYAAGQQWSVWDRNTRTLRNVQDVDPAYRNRELVTADVITEYRMTALGELSADDDRPELLLQRDDKASEEYADQANRAVAYCWENECGADEALDEADELCLDLGTSAIRCRFDPTLGPPANGGQDVPHVDGKPIYDINEARTQVAQAEAEGRQLKFQPAHQGSTVWEALSAFNILAPPGVSRERYFPWEAVIRPTLLADVMEEYGAVAAGLKEDNDIGSILGVEAQGSMGSYGTGDARESRLRDHVWLITYYERPTRPYPGGRTIVFAGKNMKVLRVDEKLPYTAPDGTPRSGITYFHWWRVSGRFFSRGLIEVMKDGQRNMNKRETQENEIIDRGMPFVIAQKDSNIKRRVGTPMELVEIDASERPPQISQGNGPGPWMHQSKEDIRAALEHATGIRGPRLGENPAQVTTYSQLALLSENERTKRDTILKKRRRGIERLVEDTIYDIRTYWGSEKQIQLAGDEGGVQSFIFNASRLPPFYIVRIAEGAAKPRSQAAELKKVEDIWQGVLNSGAVMSNPQQWMQWFKGSLDAGTALDLPEQSSDEMLEKAEIENHIILNGTPVPVAYYDLPAIHIPSHRTAQIRAVLAGDVRSEQLFEQHIQEHLVMVQQNAAQIHQIAPPQVGPDGEMLPLQPGETAAPLDTGQPAPAGQGAAPAAAAAPLQQPALGPAQAAATPPETPPAEQQQREVHIHIPPQEQQPLPDITVQPAQVTAPPPTINVQAPSTKKVTFSRDKNGLITGATVEEE